jgi:hypothetical protein
MTPLLTDVEIVHAGRQLGVADTDHAPSVDSERVSDLGPTEARRVARDLARGSGDGSSPPPETDLLILPTVPPVEPAWANTGASTNGTASTPSDPTTASILDSIPIQPAKSQPMALSSGSSG